MHAGRHRTGVVALDDPGTNPLLARLPDDSFRLARGDASRLLGKVMPFWYFATLLLLTLAAINSGGVARTCLASPRP